MLLFSIVYISLLFFKQPFIILAVERIENSSFDVISTSTSTPNITKIPFKENIINHLKQKPLTIESLPIPELLLGSKSSDSSLPVFPERPDAVYFIVAVVGGAKTWGRTLARTILDMGQPFESPQGPPLRPLYVDLPQNGRFSSKVLTSLCQQSDGQPLAGMIVIGEGQSARAIALSGSSMKMPVLWAKGGTANLHGLNIEIQNPLQAMLQPSAKEILEAIRALFLQTHWHSFFVLSDVGATMILGGSEGTPLKDLPLLPTILPLPANNDDVFRQLAHISRSTRGVVLLLCDLSSARKIMSEAQRSNMVGGHFIWLWTDTSSSTEFFDVSQTQTDENFDDKTKYDENGLVKENTHEIIDSVYHHLDDVIDRKMEFEDYDPNYRRNKSPKMKINNNQFGHIIGLNEKSSKNEDEFSDKLYKSDNFKRKRDVSSDLNKPVSYNNNENSFTNSKSRESNKRKSLKFAEEVQTGKGANLEIGDVDRFQNPYDVYKFKEREELAKRRDHKERRKIIEDEPEHSEEIIDEPDDRQDDRHDPSIPQYDSHDDETDSKLKRTAIANVTHVFFHHFKDFPVGLLALRPVRMNIDRHFIRSTIRLFASTWARVETEPFIEKNKEKIRNNKNLDRDIQYQNQNRRKFKRSYDNPVNNSLNFNQSDLNNNLVNNRNHSVHNQNISGLNLTNTNLNEKSNNLDNLTNFQDYNFKSITSKRQNTWWSVRESTWKSRGQDRNRKGAPQYRGGCFGTTSRADIRRAEHFAKALQEATKITLSGEKLADGTLEKPLTTHFEILNLVPTQQKPIIQKENAENHQQIYKNKNKIAGSTKWRRVGLVSGTSVQLDTIVWPGGDIVVSGLSAKPRSVFRVVTALAPPFVMESELDEDGLCLRGLACHRLYTSGRHNLTLMFNAIETRDRLEADAAEHGIPIPEEEDSIKLLYKTKCCYGLSMDLLDNIAMELGFEFHLYIVQDELFGTKYRNFKDWMKDPHHSMEEETNYKHYEGISSASFERKYNLNLNKGSIYGKTSSQSFFVTSKKNEQIIFLDDNQRKSKFDKIPVSEQWNGIVGELIDGSADMSFSALSVSKARAETIDFSMPYFHSGVSLVASPQTKSEIPLLAFLLPFSPELWIAIFTSLNVTAIAVAIYEWLSPFGLNPWGRQRSKNFSMSSALWVMWGLLCGHLVAFKAPKSWPNKVVINIWGGFSVIFIASYTANIAALIAGLFFHNSAHSYDASLLNQRVGVPKASAAESYIQNNDRHLWEHMKKYTLENIEEGLRGLKNGSLDLLMADSAILDYYRATDQGCSLRRIGETYVDDTYAIGMTKGFPLRDSISALIAKYSSNGYLDILTEKWYGGLPCFKLDVEIVQPRPLGVAAVAGVFLLLGLGMILGVLILIFEHLFYKYTLPILRHKPKGTVWRSRNIMFFSQKLYRFINCVDLVSPHHAARELVDTLRQGQIASLFQKSIKRKEDEQRRRRKSKAQFFDMIQEIRRAQQEVRDTSLEVVNEDSSEITTVSQFPPKPPKPPKVSPKPRFFPIKKDNRSRSNSSGLNVRRFSVDSILGERLDTIGRRLSRDITNSPPDLGHRFETFGKGESISKFDTFSGQKTEEFSGQPSVTECNQVSKFDTYSGKNDKPDVVLNKKHQSKRAPLNLDVYERENEKKPIESSHENTALRERLAPPIFQVDSSKAVLRDKLHEELKAKHGNARRKPRAQFPLPHQTKTISGPSERQTKLGKPERNGTRPSPSPRRSKRELETPLTMPRNQKTNSKPVCLDRLSKEDLLRLSHSTESEIHEYLQNSVKTRKPEPP